MRKHTPTYEPPSMQWALLATVLLVGLAPGLLSGCGGSQARPQYDLQSYDMLDTIPADTPYYAVLEPAPEGFLSRVIYDLADPGERLLEVLHDLQADLEAQAQAQSPIWRLGLTLVRELRGKLSRAGLDSLGISDRVRAIVYGVGVWPVVRLELSSGIRFSAFIERVADLSGYSFVERSFEDATYWEYQPDRNRALTLVLAVQENELMAALFDPRARAEVLPPLLGYEVPDAPLTATGRLTEQRAQLGLTPYLVAHVDTTRLVPKLVEAIVSRALR